MARFDTKRLNSFDIMEHVKNIYDILGTKDVASVMTDKSENMSERLNEIQHGNFVQWSGTMEEYKLAKASGLIKPDMLCAITDDYVGKETHIKLPGAIHQ